MAKRFYRARRLKNFLSIFLIVSFLSSSAQQKLRTWEVFEINLTAVKSSANPYAQIPVTKDGYPGTLNFKDWLLHIRKK
jgi:hypothetical protein